MGVEPTQPSSPLRQRIDAWWKETNGSGWNACLECDRHHPEHCVWHTARLDDIEALVTEYAREQVKKELEAVIKEFRAWEKKWKIARVGGTTGVDGMESIIISRLAQLESSQLDQVVDKAAKDYGETFKILADESSVEGESKQ